MTTTFELQLWSEFLSNSLPVGQEISIDVTKRILDDSIEWDFDYSLSQDETEELEMILNEKVMRDDYNINTVEEGGVVCLL